MQDLLFILAGDEFLASSHHGALKWQLGDLMREPQVESSVRTKAASEPVSQMVHQILWSAIGSRDLAALVLPSSHRCRVRHIP